MELKKALMFGIVLGLEGIEFMLLVVDLMVMKLYGSICIIDG